MDKDYDVITMGDCCVDLILSGGSVVPEFGQKEKVVDNYSLEMGGSCTIFACQAAKLGLRTAVIGKVGDDPFGDLILRRLSDAGVDVSHVARDESVRTGITVVMNTGSDRAMLTYTGTIDAIGREDVPDGLLGSTRHLHVGSYYLMDRIRPHYRGIIEAVKAGGGTVSLDTNWDPAERWDGGLKALLPLVDVLMPNENEVMAIAGAETVDAAINSLRETVPVLVVKRGKDGATVHSRGEDHAVPAVKVDALVDTVGSGDSFDAGFLYGYLNAMPLVECARIGSICGSIKTRAAGGIAGQVTLAEIRGMIGEE
ncbi:MAG: sugar kinase [Candidatus Lokiarchaeota archaeon]|nr:sugar kinase [Candidatus Lokiarchaeota archaeon]